MASPKLPFRTYRIHGVPSQITVHAFRGLLSQEENNVIEYLSFAPSADHPASPWYGTVTIRAGDDEHVTFGSQISRNPFKSYFKNMKLDTHFDGLTPLNHASTSPRMVDIIAITGLGGNAFVSWQCEQGSMWLRDFLPKDIPNVRVQIYGYASALANSNSTAGLLDYAKMFLRALQESRRHSAQKRRPLIIIGHSLGCLMIKQALVWVATVEEYKELRPCIYSIVLFGAPHRGLNTTALEKLVIGTVSERLIRDLKSDSAVLASLSAAFASASKKVKIITCFELRTTPTAGKDAGGRWNRHGPEVMMVDRISACLYVDQEERIEINENHSMIAKLSDQPSSAYHVLRSKLKDHVAKAPAVVMSRFFQLDSVEILKTIAKAAKNLLEKLPSLSCFDEIVDLEHEISANNVFRLLASQTSFYTAFQSFMEDERLSQILDSTGTSSNLSKQVFLNVKKLHQLFSVYPPLSEVSPESLVDDENQDRISNLEKSATNSAIIEEDIKQLLQSSTVCIEKIQIVLSFALLGTDSLSTMKQFEENKTAKSTGLAGIAERQACIAKSVDPAMELRPTLQGCLTEVAGRSDLRLMFFQARDASWSEKVIVEYRTYATADEAPPSGVLQAEATRSELIARHQIDQLATLLQQPCFSADNPTEIQDSFALGPTTFRCIGHLEEPANRRTAFLYRIPSDRQASDIHTLHSFIDSSNSVNPSTSLPLEQRLLLAKKVCLALLRLHSWGWVHKNFSSQNIALMPSSTATMIPYITGFEYCRSMDDVSLNSSTRNVRKDVYRHPDRQGFPTKTFAKEHDLYALGLVLYEIGVFRTVTYRFKKQFERYKAEGIFPDRQRVKAMLIEMVRHDLPKAMGTRYMKAVLKCLTGDFGVALDDKHQTRLGLAFQEQVLAVIEDGIRPS